MAHTMLCGKRQYTMPTVILSHLAEYIGAAISSNAWTALKVTNILPPSGLIIHSALDTVGNPARLRFTTAKGRFVIPASQVPTLYMCDEIIQSVEYAFIEADASNAFSYWPVADVAYFAMVGVSR